MSAQFCYSTLASETDTHPKRVDSDWTTFCTEVISHPEPRGEWPLYEYLSQAASKDKDQRARAKAQKSGRAWCPATFGNRTNDKGSLRHDGNVLAIYAGVADIDNKVDEPLTVPEIERRLNGYALALHTSYSHTPDKPRYRVIIPLAHPMPPADMPRLFAYFKSLFGSALDEACKNPSHLYFTPSYPPDAEGYFTYEVTQGEYLDPDILVAPGGAGSGGSRAEPMGLGNLRVSDKIKRLIAEGMSEEYQGDRSRACAAVISAMLASGYDSAEIVDVLMNPAHSISERPCEIGHKRLLEDILRLRNKGKTKYSGKEPIPPEQTDTRPDDRWPRLKETDKAEMLDSDRANAVRLATVWGQQLLHVEHIGWHMWADTHWRRSDEEAVRIASQLSRIILGEAATVAEAASREASEERREALATRAGKLFTCAHKSESRVRVDAALWFARALLNIRIEELNRDLYALNVRNGVIELHTGELRKHRRTDFITRCCPVAYDSKAEAPKWGAFLRRIFADDVAVINFVQRAAGYSLTGDIGEQCLFILHGSGANGKSVLLEVLGHMLGAYAKQAAPDLLLAKTQDRHPTEIADLFGSRLVTAIETSEGRRLAEALVKQMTGGDKMKARFMRQDFFEFNATHKLWLATNHKPQVRGTDYAIWRRIRLIPFEVTIPEAERDPKLAAKLIAEELPGILTWAVQGCLAWQKEGLKPPEKVQAATEAYREEMDVLAGFLGECCVIHTNANARASVLYTAYKKWCEIAGEYCVRQTIFGGQLTERGFERYTNNGVWYRGIGLVADPPVD